MKCLRPQPPTLKNEAFMVGSCLPSIKKTVGGGGVDRKVNVQLGKYGLHKPIYSKIKCSTHMPIFFHLSDCPQIIVYLKNF